MTAPKTPSTVDWSKLRTALDGLSPEELNGLAAGTHVVVPREPTKAMVSDGAEYCMRTGDARGTYLAMIEARNKP